MESYLTGKELPNDEKKDWLIFQLGSIKYDIVPSSQDIEDCQQALKKTGIGDDFNVIVLSDLYNVVRIPNDNSSNSCDVHIMKAVRVGWFRKLILKLLFGHRYASEVHSI